MKRLLFAPLVCLLALQACDSQPAATVVVYVPADFEERALDWLPQSGLDVTVVAGDSAVLTERVIDKQDAPRADVLVTSGVVDIWRAADEGALRPLGDAAMARIPVALRDPDDAWAAIDSRPLLIVHTGDMPDLAVTTYADLGSPQLKDLLCLTTSSLPANRALLGWLVADLGVKPAERVVRRWIYNLAAPPFASDAELVAALDSGVCRIGIVAAVPDLASWTSLAPAPTYYDIRAVGVTRHARNPEAGQQLVDWMLAEAELPELPGPTDRNIGVAGLRGEDARLLAERAGYR